MTTRRGSIAWRVVAVHGELVELRSIDSAGDHGPTATMPADRVELARPLWTTSSSVSKGSTAG